MPLLRTTATMTTYLTWEGHVPDDVQEDERWLWIKDNVDGSEFIEDGDGSWVWGRDVEEIEEDKA